MSVPSVDSASLFDELILLLYCLLNHASEKMRVALSGRSDLTANRHRLISCM